MHDHNTGASSTKAPWALSKQAVAITSNKKVRIILGRKVSLLILNESTLVNCASLRLMAARISYGLWTHPDMMAVE
jgi:hypothetical protein